MDELERNKEVVRRYLEAQQTGDVTILDDVLSPDFVDYMMGRPRDKQGVVAQITGMNATFSGIQYDVGALVAEGELVACQYTLTATHNGSMPVPKRLADRLQRTTLPPHGKSVTFTGMFIAKVNNGRIVGGWGEFDRLTMLTRLGLLD